MKPSIVLKTLSVYFAAIFFWAQTLSAQISISGPTCVVQGSQVTYYLSGSYSVYISRQWCVTNGIIMGVYTTCNSATGYTSITIGWSSSATSGSLSVSGSDGSATANVTLTSPLSPGSVYTSAGSTVKTQTIGYNTVPGTIFCTAASGAACYPIYSYQWQQSTDGTAWSDMTGQGSENLSFSSSLTQTMYYRRKVRSNGTNTEGYSDVATVYIAYPLTGGTVSPSSQLIASGSSPSMISCNTATNGTCGSSYSYQWQSGTDGINFTDISGANGVNCYPSPVFVTTYFRRKVTCGSETAYSTMCTVNVYPALTAGGISPSSQAITYNTSPAQLSGSLPTGGNCGSSYSYQWQKSADNASFTDISGATAQNYTPANLTATTYFRRKVSCGSDVIYTASANITVAPALSAGTIAPSSATITYNTVPGTLSATAATGGNCSGAYTYHWQSSANNSSFTDISGATSLNYTPSALTATSYFRLKITCGSETVYTTSTTITVMPQLTAGIIGGPSTAITYNTVPSLTNTAATGGNCNGTYTYQWKESTDGTNYQDIAGATAASYTPGALVQNTYFKRFVTCATESATTTPLLVQVNAQLFGGAIIPANVTIAPNTSPGMLTANPATGGACNGSYIYQWQQSADAISFTDISGATGQNYTPANLAATTYFRRKVKCGSDIGYSNLSKVSINSAACADMNYVRIREILTPGITDASAADLLINLTDVRQSTQYFDGLGRPLQTVVKGGSLESGGTPKDMVAMVEYDAFGRESVGYLPFASQEYNGEYKCNPLPEQNSFNAAQFPDDEFFYGRKDFEPSPLNRISKTFAPGNSWVGANRGVESNYWTNTDIDGVRIWNVTEGTPGSFGSYSSPAGNDGIYAEGTLYKSSTKDEEGHQLIEFKDKQGQVILKKVQLTANTDNGDGSDYDGWLCTYYIYDDLGQLRCVIQPKGVQSIDPVETTGANWSLNQQQLDEQCFRYEYDARGRMTMKKVPGSAAVFMVYDKRDRLIYTQDGNMGDKNQWIVTMYDDLNRPVITGIMIFVGSFLDLQGFADSQDPSGSSNVSVQGQARMVVSTREAARTSYQASESIEFVDGFSTIGEASADFTAEIVSASTLSETESVSGTYIPSTASFTALTMTRYDDYPSDNQKPYNTANISKLTAGANPYAETPPSTPSTMTKGMVTVGKVWTLEDPSNLSRGRWLETVNYYDDKGRIVQVQADNVTGGKEEVTTLYDFAGKVLCSYQSHNDPLSTAGVIRVRTSTKYDELGRVLSVDKQLNDDPNTDKTILENQYNALGQLKVKTLGNALETVKYDYNIRGWLLGANRDYVKDANSSSKFGFDLGYDKNGVIGSYTPQYNGNISGMVWKSAGDQQKRKYDFDYDALNRLTNASFTQWVSGTGATATFNTTSAGIDYSVENLSYDANGNIKTLWQKGWKITGSDYIDKLTYHYLENDGSNKLRNVVDAMQDQNTKLGDFRYSTLYQQTVSQNKARSATDYYYDNNGNLVKDLNKDIETHNGANGIEYNHLNLPQRITVKSGSSTDKGTISYIYDAAGIKLQKITEDKSVPGKTVTTTTTYMGAFIYESRKTSPSAPDDYTDKLQFVAMEEGRIRPKDDANNPFVYDYFLKDHLGNVRMVLTDEQKQDVYPAATLETANFNGGSALSVEDDYYQINTANVIDEPAGMGTYSNNNGNPPYNNNPYSNSSANSQKVYQLVASGGKGVTGLGMTLKVMSGDRIDIFGKSYYNTVNSSGTNYSIPILDVLNGLFGAPGSSAGLKGGTATDANGVAAITNPIASFLNNPERDDGTVPKAFVNYILFDEQFKFAGGGFSRAGSDHASDLSNITVEKNGYIYVYVSNESPVAVFFDNLQVIHTRGPLLEETHYYPFGLVMSGISSKTLNFGQPENKKKFNAGSELQNKEFSDGSGLEMYDTKYRGLDPQIGRWWQLDPKPNHDFSLYSAFDNNPIRFNDPLGDTLPPPPKNAWNPLPPKKINPWNQPSGIDWSPPGSKKPASNNNNNKTPNEPSNSNGNNTANSDQPTTGTTVTIKVGKDGNTYIDGTGGKTETSSASGQQYGKPGVLNQDASITHNQDGTVDIQFTYSIGPLSVSTDYMGSISVGYEIQPGIQLSLGQTARHKLTGGISATSSTGHVDEANLKYTPNEKIISAVVGGIFVGTFGPAGGVFLQRLAY